MLFSLHLFFTCDVMSLLVVGMFVVIRVSGGSKCDTVADVLEVLFLFEGVQLGPVSVLGWRWGGCSRGSYTGLGLVLLGFSVEVVSYVSVHSLGGANAGMGLCFWFGYSGLGLRGRVVLVLMPEWLGWGWSFVS